ncbi:MAG TPA: O-antigen ligase family protein [Candidatus Paceibacterota bacterium]|nr:O-antigen ligase family protein [Candidatus Paceibacterota bacterium]
MFFPFITGKNFAFRILVEVATAMWALLLFIDKEARPRFSWILAGAGAFLVALTIADFSGVDPQKSIWSNYERMEGLVTHVHLFLYFLVAGSVLTSEHLWGWFANTWLGSSIFIFFGAIAQIYGKEAYNFGAGRVDAGLGNAAYMGIYAVFNVFLAVLLWVKTDKKSWWRYAYPVFGLANMYMVFKSQTRGSMLGMFAGAGLIALCFALFDKARPQFRKYAAGAVLAGVLLTGLFVANRHAEWIKNYPSLNRLAQISASDTTTNSRITIWKMSYEGWKERPVFGWGQENFIYVFAKYYDPQMYHYEPWYDRSHDVFFDWLVAAGAVGLLAYLSLYVGIIYYLWFYKKGEVFSLAEKSVVTGMVAAYFIHNVFVFDNLVSYMFFFALLGWMHARVIPPVVLEQKKKGTTLLEGGDLFIVGSVLIVLLSAVMYFVNIRDINANHDLLKAIRGDGNATYVENGKQKIRLLDALDQAEIGKSEAREQLVQQALQAMQQKNVPDTLKKEYFEMAQKEIEGELARNPTNLRMHTFAIMFYANTGNIKHAEEILARALELSPTRGSLYLDSVNMRLSNSDVPGALQLAEKAHELMPDNSKATVAYAAMLILSGKQALAKELLTPLAGDPALVDERLAYAYSKVGAASEMISIFAGLDAAGKLSSQNYLVYADALMKAGRKQEGVAMLRKAATLDASLSAKVEEYIKTLK